MLQRERSYPISASSAVGYVVIQTGESWLKWIIEIDMAESRLPRKSGSIDMTLTTSSVVPTFQLN